MNNDVRIFILNFLKEGDKKPKSVKEVRDIASEKGIYSTEGVWAAAFRDLRSSGKIKRTSRGFYQIQEDEVNLLNVCKQSIEKAYKEIDKSVNSLDVFQLKEEHLEDLKKIKKVLQSLNQIKCELE